MTKVHDESTAAGSPPAMSTAADMDNRLIDAWFPCPEVDMAVSTPAGSGRSEKALFTWFASRPIAQARAAVLCSLLPDTDANRADVKLAVRSGDAVALGRLRGRIAETFSGKPPVMLDIFSGRGIIPLEAARFGVTSVGTDLSPVATLAGRLLADYPLRDWSREPELPFADESLSADEDGTEDADSQGQDGLFDQSAVGKDEPRLLTDVRRVLAEVGRRVRRDVAQHYVASEAAAAGPWALFVGSYDPLRRMRPPVPAH